jgi:hypothetical protein
MPHLRKAFTSFKQFAGAELTDIYKPDRLKNALKLNAAVFESGILINDSEVGGAIQFTFKALPRIAQIAPSFGVVVQDVNHDGKADLYLAQNFHSPQVETGRMSGGLSQLLLGKGDGSFEPIPAEQSGLWVPGDAASLTRADVNGDGAMDFVIAKNNGPLEVFERGAGKDNTIQVNLRGATGNPTALGARIRVEFDTKQTLAEEIYGGGGYLSQSPASLSFSIPDGAKKMNLTINWPDGSESQHQSDLAEESLEIKQPE